LVEALVIGQRTAYRHLGINPNPLDCFDEISHEWLIANVPMDKAILIGWLKAGYMHEGLFKSTDAGTPQGGIISPTLANMGLDGPWQNGR
ncbi:hypothetical protein CE195_02820, partial [Sodalis-like symbiont of Philaenus spumarius]